MRRYALYRVPILVLICFTVKNSLGSNWPKGIPMRTRCVQDIENMSACECYAFTVVPNRLGKVLKYEAKKITLIIFLEMSNIEWGQIDPKGHSFKLHVEQDSLVLRLTAVENHFLGADSLLVTLKCDLPMVCLTIFGVTVQIFHLRSLLWSAGSSSTGNTRGLIQRDAKHRRGFRASAENQKRVNKMEHIFYIIEFFFVQLKTGNLH